MSENTNPDKSSEEIATSVGQTGGLPGHNAAPATAQVAPEELADTVNIGVEVPTDD